MFNILLKAILISCITLIHFNAITYAAPMMEAYQLEVKVYLEGAYQTGGLMSTHLSTANLLPNSQPFNRSPWNYEGTETTVSIPNNTTDWMLVEIRDAAMPDCIVEQLAVFVRYDGYLMDIDGTPNLTLNNVNTTDSYLLIIRSRNHLAIVNEVPLTFPQTNIYDFTELNSVQGTDQLVLTNDGNYAMLAGDFNSDGILSVADFNIYVAESASLNQYTDSDVNLDGSTTIADFNLYLPNSSSIGISFVRYPNNSSPCVASTPPAAVWFSSVSGSEEESHGHYIMTCADGGFLQVGETGFIPLSAKILVAKIDAFGNLVWKKEFGNSGHNLGNSALEVADGYLICGALNQNSALLKLNKTDGSVIFSQTYNNGGSDALEHIALTDTGLAAVGYVNAWDAGNTFYTEGQGYMMFLDNGGNELSSQNLNAYTSHAYRIKSYNDELIISGLSEEALEYTLLKMDFAGNILWSNTYGGNDYDHCFGLDVSDNGTIFLTGHTLSGTINWDTYTMQIDNGGNLLWEKVQGNPRGFNPLYIHDEAWGIKATPDGGCIVVAGTGDEYTYSECNATSCSDTWHTYIIKYDAAGNLEWETTYFNNDGGDTAGEDIDLTEDGGAIIAVDNGQFGFLRVAAF